MNHQKRKAAGYLSFTLHAHLPYVVNHGTWPHGMEWLLEAAAETYLPLLRVFGNLERDRIALHYSRLTWATSRRWAEISGEMASTNPRR